MTKSNPWAGTAFMGWVLWSVFLVSNLALLYVTWTVSPGDGVLADGQLDIARTAAVAVAGVLVVSAFAVRGMAPWMMIRKGTLLGSTASGARRMLVICIISWMITEAVAIVALLTWLLTYDRPVMLGIWIMSFLALTLLAPRWTPARLKAAAKEQAADSPLATETEDLATDLNEDDELFS